jgi:exopolysaccharide biosynthesis polyprenyl glycosylphosphotransferase
MSSDLGTGIWGSPVEGTLTRLPRSQTDIAPVHAPPGAPALPEVELEAVTAPGADPSALGPPVARDRRNGLRTRLVLVDAAAAAGTWLVLGAIAMPETVAIRRWVAALAATAATLVAMRLLGLYRSRVCMQRGQQALRIAIAVLVGAVCLELLRGEGDHGRAATIVAAGTCALALMASRWMFLQWLRAQRARGRYSRGLVMIGTNEDAAAVWTMLHSQPELGYDVRGIIGRPRSHIDWNGLPTSPTIGRLPEIASQTGATGVLLVTNALSAAEVHDVIELSANNGLHVQIWPGLQGLGRRRVRRFQMSGETFLYVEPGQRPTWQFAAKRCVDVVVAALGLLLALPVLLLAWIAIRVDDPGPALYRQVRVGLNGQPFVVYKLRTMTLDPDTGIESAELNERTDGPLFKASHDPRVTRIGTVLRALSIDEIPQLYNVLAGTMSLVGPRPALPHEVAQFDPELLRRHSVRPGITGLWQLEARDNPSFHAYRRLDLLYVDNWSFGLDLFILLATVPMVIAHAIGLFRRDEALSRSPSEAPS